MTANAMLHKALAILLCASVAGCVSMRHATMVDVPDVGDKIPTKYRYYYVGTAQEDFCRWLEDGSEKGLESVQNELSKFQPNVFSKEGIPILFTVRTTREERWGNSDAAKLGWFAFYMCTAGLSRVRP